MKYYEPPRVNYGKEVMRRFLIRNKTIVKCFFLAAPVIVTGVVLTALWFFAPDPAQDQVNITTSTSPVTMFLCGLGLIVVSIISKVSSSSN